MADEKHDVEAASEVPVYTSEQYPPQPDYAQQQSYPPQGGYPPQPQPGYPQQPGYPPQDAYPPQPVAQGTPYKIVEAAVAEDYCNKLTKLRIAQLCMCLVAGIFSQIPVTVFFGTSSITVFDSAWVIIAHIFAMIVAGGGLYILKKRTLGDYVSPAGVISEFIIVIFLFSASIMVAQYASAVQQVTDAFGGTATAPLYALAVIAALLSWFAWVSFLFSLFLVGKLTKLQQDLNRVNYFGQPVVIVQTQTVQTAPPQNV